jgi:hypothetical protein
MPLSGDAGGHAASETLVDSVWLLVVLFVLFNGFFFFDVYPRYRYEDIDVLDFACATTGNGTTPDLSLSS